MQRDLKTLYKIWFFKVQLLARCGIPDIIGVIDGHFFALELKMTGKKPTKLQLYTIEKIKEAGGIAFVVFPDTWPDIFRRLRESQGL